MSKKASKTNGQYWYQVHKSKAGDESVASSIAVVEAKRHVQALELKVQKLKLSISEGLGSNLRRLLLGPNPNEEEYQQALELLKDARRAAATVEAEIRRSGEKAYGADWADRNPDRARNS